MKERPCVSIEKEKLNLFRKNLKKHGLKFSPVIEALIDFFNEELEGKINDAKQD